MYNYKSQNLNFHPEKPVEMERKRLSFPYIYDKQCIHMKPVTLKEIAARLNISVSTVSKALKDYPDIGVETKEQVRELARSLNYKPNTLAVNLRTNESKTIGLIIPEIVHHFFSNVIKGIVSSAEKRGYLVIILQSNESNELEKKQIQLLLDQRVDGVIISLANDTEQCDHIKYVLEQKTPLVMFDKVSKRVECSKVIINDRKAAYEATRHLIEKGCRRIAHFRGALTPLNSIDRFMGYRNALLDHGLEFDPSLVYICQCDDRSFEEGKENAKKLLEDHNDIDGIFINTDLVAIGALTEFRNQGINVPEDLKVVGFSNWFMSSVISPSLTTIDQPGFQMGETAFDQLFVEIETLKKGKDPVFKTIELETELIERESTG